MTSATVPAAATSLPPGPSLPMPVQALLFATRRHLTYPRWQRRYGDMFTVRLPGRNAVVLADPDVIREVFSGPPAVFHAGEGNEILRQVMGEHSLLLLDEDDHLRARKLLMPAFAGAALRGYRDMFTEIAEAKVAHWRVGKPVRLIERFQEITLEVILRVVFGVADDRASGRIRPLLRRIVGVNPLIMLGGLYPALRRVPPWRAVYHDAATLDSLLYQEIRDRRNAPDLAGRRDVLTRLLREASTASGGLSDRELRDQLITLLLAGHETTSTALAWTVHELVRHPGAMRAAVASADGDGDDYLEAAVKEAMRVHPVVPAVARMLTEPVRIGGHLLPVKTVVTPSIQLVQQSPRQHRDPHSYRPERFAEGTVSTANWFPFGGGVRRCIGASFSLSESVAILRVVLRRFTLTGPSSRPEPTRARNVTLIPARGATAVVTPR